MRMNENSGPTRGAGDFASIDRGNAPAPRRVDPRALTPTAPRGIRPASVRGAATRRMPRNARY